MAYTTINKPNTHFDTTLFTGDNASGRTFTGLNFAPDMIWGKSRDTTNLNHQIVDIVRGGTKFLFTNSNVAEDTASHGQITSWNSDGTTWADGTNGTYPRLYYNDNGQLGGAGSRVWWQWKANGAGVSNTQGNLTSTVSANTTSGFSIVNYTTNSTANRTIGHGLGVAPAMIIIKNKNAVSDWAVYHKSLGNTKWIRLNSTDIAYTASDYWNNTSPTSTVFTIGATNTNVNDTSGNTYTAYCFAEVKGFSKFGSYIGNGSADGTFVYTGFKPAYLIIKNVDLGAGYGFWAIWDNKRNANNPENIYLEANATSADNSGDTGGVDFLSNGFKLRNSYDYSNKVNTNYIYMAFAEQPLVGTNNVPATAR